MNDHITGEDLAAYVDGMLRPDKKSALENHFSCCPACLDELVEITAIMRSRDKVLAGGQGKVLAEGQGKIPTQFLKRALGKESKVTKSILHLRLVFKIAAVFVVVVFIGYLFLSNNRFWQTPEGQKPLIVMDKNVRFPEISIHAEEIAPLPTQRRDLTAAKKTNNQRTKAAADQTLSDSFASEKRGNAVTGKGLSAASGKSLPAREQENKLKESAEERPRPAIEKESSQKNELGRTAAVPEALGATQMDLAAKNQAAAKVRKEMAAGAPQPRIRIEGDVVWTDLRNPELIFAWSWFPKGLALELQINGAGAVIAVVPLGKIDPLLARQAENEAKKLLFSVSKKKSRRGRLVAN